MGGWVGAGGCLWVNCLLLCCCICDSLKFYMKHGHVLKKLNLDILTPPPKSDEVGGVCWQNICYRDAAFVISFNFICNMPMF